jgi:hypothetical protein
MRFSVTACVLGVLALGVTAGSPSPATADKSKMGCDTVTETWNAALGQCEPGTPKYKRKSDQPPLAPKVTATAKAAPVKKAAKKAPAAAK